MNTPKMRLQASEEGACQHCGALVYGDTLQCPQCGKFPIMMHKCPRCGSIASKEADRCWKCGRIFEPGSDYF